LPLSTKCRILRRPRPLSTAFHRKSHRHRPDVAQWPISACFRILRNARAWSLRRRRRTLIPDVNSEVRRKKYLRGAWACCPMAITATAINEWTPAGFYYYEAKRAACWLKTACSRLSRFALTSARPLPASPPRILAKRGPPQSGALSFLPSPHEVKDLSSFQLFYGFLRSSFDHFLFRSWSLVQTRVTTFILSNNRARICCASAGLLTNSKN